MNKLIIALISIVLLSGCIEPTEISAEKETITDNSETFSPELAQKVGADSYGMRKYVMAFLKAGPNRDLEVDEAEKLQRTHLDNINKLADQGLLQLAGPFMDQGDLKGIYIFSVETKEEAKKLVETDPAIKAGSLEMELHSWYGSAALMEIPRLHKKVSKVNI